MPVPARFVSRACPVLHGHRRYESGRRHSFSTSRQSELASWPCTATPSPHEILGVKPGQAYSKENFHRLVKLYHPDMYDASVERAIPRAVGLERYRLVIAAHNILSDPQKRRLYETCNEGWGSGHRPAASQRAGSWDREASTTTNNNTEPPSAMRQKPIHTSNATFAMVLLALAMLGAVLQVKRLRSNGERQRMLQIVLQDAIMEELQAWASILDGQSRDDRILAFLARRHGVPQQLERWTSRHASCSDKETLRSVAPAADD
ncbi:hypothetical protein JDV02_002066 [Purpureocillium takamizusanense]|uniref:J domain-containing protein n=1 Tax=Purpureocillium takamizusanense TaxID=2060973 RepID=A0A9Q8V882_9HYPO|nr:uncharacterized protein JDV02_002066 [Purpureocillium takamizusanense]UNI15542.1 hypothetical protein JDV02_002066 [Purpureocillium takamizusanense]